MRLKFFSWNVNRANSQSKLHTVLGSGEYDVICLQEVNKEFLKQLNDQLHGYFIHVADETLITSKRTHHLHLVTLVKGDIFGAENFTHETFQPIFYRRLKREIFIEYSYVDFRLHDQEFRVFNCHLQCVAPPQVRVKQFDEVLTKLAKEHHNVICGDLNAFSRPLLAFVGPALSYEKADYFVNESHYFNDIEGFMNPFRKQQTTIYPTGQLDYILVPEYAKLISARVDRKKKDSSDHYPIVLCLEVNEYKEKPIKWKRSLKDGLL